MNIIEYIKDLGFRWDKHQNLDELNEIRSPQFISYRDVNNVLLMFESEWSEQNAHIIAMGKALEADGKRVIYCMYVAKKQAITTTLPQRIVIDLEHVNFFGRPDPLTIAQLEETHYDILIDLTKFACRPMRYVLLHANASTRCGIKGEKDSFYDLKIDLGSKMQAVAEDVPEPTEEEMATELFKHIHHYLKSFK
ncbi:MAG: hypothetical protein Q4D14_07635 [Bacteroidales bacterium]|nr:hypothetical protein [Bacteroidales bacterium]